MNEKPHGDVHNIKKADKSIRTFNRTFKKSQQQAKKLQHEIENITNPSTDVSDEDAVNYATRAEKKSANIASDAFTKVRKNPIRKYRDTTNQFSYTKEQWQNAKRTVSNSRTVAKENVQDIKKTVSRGAANPHNIKTREIVTKSATAKTKSAKDIGKASQKIPIKTQKAASSAYRSMSNTSRAAVRARQSARIATEYGRATIHSARAVSTAIKATVHAAAALLKSSAALIAAGSGMVIFFVIIIAIVGIILSQYGVLATDNKKMSVVIENLNREFDNHIATIVANSTGFNTVEVDNGGYNSESFVGWVMALPVYNVRCIQNQLDSTVIQEENISLLRETMWDFVMITSQIEEKTYLEFVLVPDENGILVEKLVPITKQVLVITVQYKEAIALSPAYGFSQDEHAVLVELLKPEYFYNFFSIIAGETT